MASMGYKPVLEMESLRYQLDLFDSFSTELQAAYLGGVLGFGETKEPDPNREVEQVKTMLEYWKSGDVEAIGDMIDGGDTDNELTREFNQKLIETRNANMLENVMYMLTEDDTNNYFVVVGAGHMVNSTGIVEGLRQNDYTVEHIK